MMTAGEHGFSMIEVLISVLVLTTGVIGAAGMQLTALRTAQQSALQTRALFLASEMADMMRTNRAQSQDDSANPYLQVDYQVSAASQGLSDSSCYRVGARCDAEQLAHFEIDQWLQQLHNDFPGGRVRICRDASPWNAAARQFNWECTNAANSVVGAAVVIKIGWQVQERTGGADDEAAAAPQMVLTVAGYAK